MAIADRRNGYSIIAMRLHKDSHAKMTQARSSKAWLRTHAQDAFVKRAKKEGYRSRAVYKLREIDERYRLFRAAMTVLDLGAAPGAWSQYVRRKVGSSGRVLAVDLLALAPIAGVEFIRGDIADPTVLDLLMERLAPAKAVDLVISDVAPSISGERISDQARIVYLCQRVLDFGAAMLNPGGKLLLKAFQGEGITDFRQLMEQQFTEVLTCKPRASRGRSREVYLLGKGFRRSARTQELVSCKEANVVGK